MSNVTMSPFSEVEVIQGNFYGKDIVSLDQFTVEDLFTVFHLARQMKELVQRSEPSQILAGKIISLLFFEPSSRTFASFASAVKRLGGQTLDIQNPETVTSVHKGETFEDTIRVFEAYSDAIVLRHPRSGAARAAAEAAQFVPLVNAGDGTNEHPTQTLLDLCTLYERFGRLDHLTGLLAGDALNSRTMHSLMRGLSLFPGNRLYILAPQKLRLTRDDYVHIPSRGVELIELSDVNEIPPECHFWYWTRIQKERFSSLDEYYELAAGKFVVTPELLTRRASKDMILLDPLPRVGTIDSAVDQDERAVYLRSQIRNGLYTRMALLALLLAPYPLAN
ncbi:MAG TPA: aspartate carbamoyltransferase [Ktedonobacteraceae bacterium]|nr:aspartate carbamoyltransferase [Ktedonobacteraceae bacterium]